MTQKGSFSDGDTGCGIFNAQNTIQSSFMLISEKHDCSIWIRVGFVVDLVQYSPDFRSPVFRELMLCHGNKRLHLLRARLPPWIPAST